jgi:hypothetical protein
VVGADSLDPVAEPLAQRRDQRLAEQRMLPQLVPLLVRGLAGLVEDLRADLELPDVVEQRRPVEVVEIVALKPELPAEAVRVGADALGVTAGEWIVHVERRDQLEQDLGGFLRGRCPACAMQARLQALDRSRTERQPEPRRRLVREYQGQSEERAEWEQPLRQRVADRDDEGREPADPQPPGEKDPERGRRNTREQRDALDEDHGGRDREAVDEQPDGARTPGVRRPPTHVRLARRSHPRRPIDG